MKFTTMSLWLALVTFPGLLTASGQPAWISALPEEPGRIYAMGLAPTKEGLAEALTQASHQARGEVLSRLRASVKAETTVSSRANLTQATGGRAMGSSEQQVDRRTRIQAEATELPGLVVAETWEDRKGGTAYALAYLDVPVAERELKARFLAQKKDLFQEDGLPPAPRDRLRKLHRLRGAQVELAKLDDLSALVAAGGGDPRLRGQIREGRLAVDREMEQLRNALVFSLEGAKGANPLAAILRNAALEAGLGWAETGGDFRLVMDFRSKAGEARLDVPSSHWSGGWGGGWVTHTTSQATGIIVARGVLSLTLVDRAGTEYEAVDVEAKGLGVSEFQAEQKLKEDFKVKLEKTFAEWLENLVK